MNSKTTYAQSSDIKSRSFLEYRHDMKKKAIAELEFLPFLQDLLAPAIVEKFGADKDLWFLRSGGKITQEPDYLCTRADGTKMFYEFQYTESIDKLKYFDFKVSKVGLKKKGERTPYDDRRFFYVVKPTAQYAFVAPSKIMENGKQEGVPAWGNRTAYRVPVDKFSKFLKDGGDKIRDVISTTDDKNLLLNFQQKFLLRDTEEFASELQNAVDQKRLIEIMPTTLEGFYRICFLLARINETPQFPNVWLVYLLSFFKRGLMPGEMARWMFAIDFLYFKCDKLSDNEVRSLEKALDNAWKEINSWELINGYFARDPNISPVEETAAIIHAANLLEDIRQDFFVTYNRGERVNRIFEVLPNFAETANFIRSIE